MPTIGHPEHYETDHHTPHRGWYRRIGHYLSKRWHKLRPHIPQLNVIVAWSTIVLGAAALWSVHISYKALDDARKAADRAHQDNVDALKQAQRDSDKALSRAHADANKALAQLRSDDAAALTAARNSNAQFAEASRIQAQLTSESNAINKEAFTAVQRAFIIVDQLGTVDVFRTNGTQREYAGEYFFPIIQNSGNTPAIIAQAILITPYSSWYGKASIIDQNRAFSLRAPADPSALLAAGPDNTTATLIKNTVLGPKGIIQPVEGHGSDTIFMQQAFTPRPGSFGQYFFGAIEYKDIFNAKHLTMYCFSVNNATINGGTGTHIQPARCSHWNCADKQCDNDRKLYDFGIATIKPGNVQAQVFSPTASQILDQTLPLPSMSLPPLVKTFIVFFDSDRAILKQAAHAIVTEAVKIAKTNGFAKIQIVGHTDTIGSDSDDMKLSRRRAQAVKDEMVREGMNGSAITVVGRGFHDLLIPTPSNVREPQNNRAVIDLGR